MYDSPLLQLSFDPCLVIYTLTTEECSEINGHYLQLVIQLDCKWRAFLSKEPEILKDWPNTMFEYLVVEPEQWIILEVLILSS